MAKNSNLLQNIKISFMLIIGIMVWLPQTISIDPLVSCPLGREYYPDPENCTLSDYRVDFEGTNCPSRRLCYLGLREMCDPNDKIRKCAPTLTCSSCGWGCMGCIGINNCFMKLCSKNAHQKRWFSPYKNNLLPLYNQLPNVPETEHYYD